MGLDLYSGQLTRYYSRNWETIVQQHAKEQGINCELIDATGHKIKSTENKDEIDQVRESIIEWEGNLAANLNPPIPAPLWDETTECDYYTDKPDWPAFGALALLQACQTLNRPLPEYIEERRSVFDNPILKEAMSENIPNSLLYNVTMWIPIRDKLIIETAGPTGDRIAIATVPLLRKELEELNQKLWKADEATILSWREDKYYDPIIEESTEPRRLFGFIPLKKKRTKVKFRTEDLAQCAFSMFYAALLFAEEHKVPILLDY